VTRLGGLLLALLLGACAMRPPHPDAFSFGIFGDAPYSANQNPAFERVIEEMNGEPLAFVVHIGDMKAGSDSPCTDALYAERKAQFDRVAHPFLYIPGDNDWVDCRRPSNGASEPTERLARLRQVFYGDAPLSSHRFAQLERQPGYPENTRWSRGGVVFVTLNIQGSNDNFGFDAANDAEHAARKKANLAWLSEAVGVAARAGARGLTVTSHANPFVSSKQDVYEPYLEAMRVAAERLRRPVLLIHGDTHRQRVDQPFVDAGGRPYAYLRRMETYGSPWVGWVKVTVDPADPNLFRFDPRIP
jgi:hypothetical protein